MKNKRLLIYLLIIILASVAVFFQAFLEMRKISSSEKIMKESFSAISKYQKNFTCDKDSLFHLERFIKNHDLKVRNLKSYKQIDDSIWEKQKKELEDIVANCKASLPK